MSSAVWEDHKYRQAADQMGQQAIQARLPWGRCLLRNPVLGVASAIKMKNTDPNLDAFKSFHRKFRHACKAIVLMFV